MYEYKLKAGFTQFNSEVITGDILKYSDPGL